MNLSLDRIKSQNQMTNIYIGSALLILSILDVFLNSFEVLLELERDEVEIQM